MSDKDNGIVFDKLVRATIENRESEARNLTTLLCQMTGESPELIEQLVQGEILDAQNYAENSRWNDELCCQGWDDIDASISVKPWAK